MTVDAWPDDEIQFVDDMPEHEFARMMGIGFTEVLPGLLIDSEYVSLAKDTEQ